jgi:DNA mismatch repair protein MutS
MCVRPFHSILFDRPDHAAVVDEPEFFGDLNLDQVVGAVTAGREAYDLTPLFYAPLPDPAAVRYRHEVLRDLEHDTVRALVEDFAQRMRAMREQRARSETLHYRYQQQRWFLDAVDTYRSAIAALRDGLGGVEVASRGLREFRDYLAGYADTAAFHSLVADTRAVLEALTKVNYCVHLRGFRVRVATYDGEADYSAEVEQTFAKFQQGEVKDHLVAPRDYMEMDHVEAQVLDQVARLYPDTFHALQDYCARHRDYLDDSIATFDREVQFYLAYLAYVQRFTAAGLAFCYPQVSTRSKQIAVTNAFDLALATKLVLQNEEVVRNDIHLDGRERVVVVTGPNQGGKTTFARMFGQLPYLASLGCPVPATSARLFLPDRVFSHFEREENLATLRGKLDDELVRIRDILECATGSSIIVMNESFASTTANDALFIGTEVLKRVIELDSVAVYVTFVDELAALDEAVVSMVGAVDEDDPTLRTYKVTRRPADGLAYAAALAAKHGLGYRTLRRRIGR